MKLLEDFPDENCWEPICDIHGQQLFPRGTKLPQIDAIRDTLKVIDIDGLKQINQHIVDGSGE